MIGNGQSITYFWLEQVFFRNLEVLKDKPIVKRVLERVEPIRHNFEVLVFLCRKLSNKCSRLAVNQTNQTDSASRNGICDEELLAINHIMIAIQHSSRLQRRQVRAGTGLSKSET